MRSRLVAATLVGLVACKPASKGVPDAAGAPGVGRLPVDVQMLPPEPTPGFTACHDLAEPPVTVEAGRARRERWRKERAPPPVHPSDARATMMKGTLTLSSTTSSTNASRATFDFGGEGVTAPASIRAALKDGREFPTVHDELLSSLFPDAATVALVGTSRSGESATYRLYALAERAHTAHGLLGTAGSAAASNLACTFEEGSFHRDQYRVEASPGRLTFTIDAFYGDYGTRWGIDLRVLDLGRTSAVLACLYEGRSQVDPCDRVASSFAKH